MKLDRKVRNAGLGFAVLTMLVVATVLWAMWDHSVNISVGWIVLAVAGFAAPIIVRFTRSDWSWTLILMDPLGALRSRAGRWLAALGTWMLVRWLVPRLTVRYRDSGVLARLNEVVRNP